MDREIGKVNHPSTKLDRAINIQQKRLPQGIELEMSERENELLKIWLEADIEKSGDRKGAAVIFPDEQNVLN